LPWVKEIWGARVGDRGKVEADIILACGHLYTNQDTYESGLTVVVDGLGHPYFSLALSKILRAISPVPPATSKHFNVGVQFSHPEIEPGID
jgi:hypothetical protein